LGILNQPAVTSSAKLPVATSDAARLIKTVPVCVEADQELGSRLEVTCDTGEVAEVSWSFIRELPPGK